MAGILISMLIIMLILFISTRIIWIYVIKNDGFLLEIHLPVIAIQLKKNERGNTKAKKRKKTLQQYRMVAGPILKLIKSSEIIINRIEFPPQKGELSNSTFTRPYRYQGAFFALYVYLKSKSEKLTLRDDAIVLSSDSSALLYDLTFKLRLYQLIFTVISIVYGNVKEKLKED